MSKAILVMDMPKSCAECPCCYITEGCYSDICQVNYFGLEEGYEKGRPNWCPLRELPQKQENSTTNSTFIRGYKNGYNDCIHNIMKGSAE